MWKRIPFDVNSKLTSKMVKTSVDDKKKKKIDGRAMYQAKIHEASELDLTI